MTLTIKTRMGNTPYNYFESNTSFKSDNLKTDYLTFMNNVVCNGEEATFKKYFGRENNSEYYSKFALFLSLEDSKELRRDSSTLKFIIDNNVSFKEFMQDDEKFNNIIELLIQDEVIVKNKKSFGPKNISYNKSLRKMKIADSIDLYNICALVDEYFSLKGDESSYNYFLVFMKEQFDLCNTPYLNTELKIKYYQDYWGYIESYSNTFGRFSTVSNMQIFLYLFTEKLNEATGVENNVRRVRMAANSVILNGVSVNFKFFLLHNYYKITGDYFKLMELLEKYRIDSVKVFKNILESMEENMPMEWQLELIEGVEFDDMRPPF